MSNLEAHHRFARITARKARYVADLVRGQNVNRALDVLSETRRRGSFFLARVLRSAIANATRDGSVNANRLFIRELQVDAGPLLQGRFRYNPGPMGRALPIRKRTCHIHVILGEASREGAETGATKGKAAPAGSAPGTAPIGDAPKREAAETAEKPAKRASKAKTKSGGGAK